MTDDRFAAIRARAANWDGWRKGLDVIMQHAPEDITYLLAQLDTAQQEREALIADKVNAKREASNALVSFARASQEREAAEASLSTIRQQLETVPYVLAQLRHAYEQVHGNRVSRRGMQEFADGLIAPQIRKLEALAALLDLPVSPKTTYRAEIEDD
jgi:uncharacterized protein YPO0396